MTRVADGPGRLFAALFLLCVMAAGRAEEAELDPRIDFDIPQQPADLALMEFAEQADLTLAVPRDVLRDIEANALVGRYTLQEGVDILLADTGLVPALSNKIVLSITAGEPSADRGETMKTSRKAGLLAVLAGLFGAAAAAQEAGDTPAYAERSVVVGGIVRAAGTDANLKGALVEILGTTRSTATDDLGRFRFPGMTPGEYTLRITYLGRVPIVESLTVSEDDFSRVFAMNAAHALDTIVVYGSRSARAQSLNQERAAENTATVIASDLLGDFTGTTISESLRRVPGVVFRRSGANGDGTNIIIRGLEPDLNAIKLNGVELPEGSGVGRSASLGNILTDSIDKIVVSKTLLPNQDSSGTGGLVEIETKSPLDRNRRFASFQAEGATRSKGFNDEFLVGGVLSGTFGEDESMGLSVSAQYRERQVKNLSYNLDLDFGEYLPLQVDGTPSVFSIFGIDPREPFPFAEDDAASRVFINRNATTFDSTDSENLSVTVSGAWNLADRTTLRFDYQRSESEDERLFRNADILSSHAYTPDTIEQLGGEIRNRIQFGDFFQVNQFYIHQPKNENVTDVYSLNGETYLEAWSLNYTVGYTKGSSESQTNLLNLATQGEFDAAFLLPEAMQSDGRILSVFPERTGDGYPLPLLNEAGFAFYNNPDTYGFRSAQYLPVSGENERWAADFSVKREFEGERLRYLEFGMNYEDARFDSFDAPVTTIAANPTGSFPDLSYPGLSQYGLFLDQSTLGDIGLEGGFRVFGSDGVIDFLSSQLPNSADVLDSADPDAQLPGRIVRSVQVLTDELENEQTVERELALYAQGRFELGRLELIGGGRFSSVDVIARDFRSNVVVDTSFSVNRDFRLVENRATQRTFLPRLQANYRRTEDQIFRLSYYESIARPQINLISSANLFLLNQNTFFGPSGNQRLLSVRKGNPDLKPADSRNFDLSMEYYFDSVGVIKLGAFYKSISNLLENNTASGEVSLADITLPDDPAYQDVLNNPEDYFILVSTPLNNDDDAEIWGFETSFEKQFPRLPGFWGGLGIYANYTYTDSSKEQPITWSEAPVLDGSGNVIGLQTESIVISDVRFNDQAKHSGTFGLTYNKYNFDANIAYTAQSRRQTAFAGNGLPFFEEAYETLDFRGEYRFRAGGGQYRVFLEGLDLLRGSDDASLLRTRGADDGRTRKYYDSGTYFGGRQLRVGVLATF